MTNELDELFGEELSQDTNEELTTINILSLFDTDKMQRAAFCQDVIDKMRDGEVEPLRAHLYIKKMENIIEIFTDRKKYPATAIDYQRIILEAAEKNGKKFQFQNAEFSVKEVGVSYDFSKCEDPELAEMMRQQEILKEAIKAKQDFLKTIPAAGIEMLFGDEVIRCFPPSKSSTTSVAVSLK